MWLTLLQYLLYHSGLELNPRYLWGVCLYREKHTIRRIWYSLWFQASTGGLEMYSPWIGGLLQIVYRFCSQKKSPRQTGLSSQILHSFQTTSCPTISIIIDCLFSEFMYHIPYLILIYSVLYGLLCFTCGSPEFKTTSLLRVSIFIIHLYFPRHLAY